MGEVPNFSDSADADLLASMVRPGDAGRPRQAFDEFYRRHIAWLYAHARRAVVARRLDPDLAGDLVQETFERAFRFARTFVPHGDGHDAAARKRTQAWLGQIANRILSDASVEIPAQTSAACLDDLPASPSSPNETPLMLLAREELDKLSARDKDVILSWAYHYKPGNDQQRLPDDESRALAARWSTTADNIRQIRKRALDRLRIALEPAFLRKSVSE